MPTDSHRQRSPETWTLVIQGPEGKKDIPFKGADIARLMAHFPALLQETVPTEEDEAESTRSPEAPLFFAPHVKSIDFIIDPNIPQILLTIHDFLGSRTTFGLSLDIARTLARQMEDKIQQATAAYEGRKRDGAARA